jgi:hypothetical protein
MHSWFQDGAQVQREPDIIVAMLDYSSPMRPLRLFGIIEMHNILNMADKVHGEKWDLNNLLDAAALILAPTMDESITMHSSFWKVSKVHREMRILSLSAEASYKLKQLCIFIAKYTTCFHIWEVPEHSLRLEITWQKTIWIEQVSNGSDALDIPTVTSVYSIMVR